MTRIELTAALAFAGLLSGAALAQEEAAPPPSELSVEDSAILPSADGHLDSSAPTMALDCENRPEDCVEPLEGSSEGPTVYAPDDPATAVDESVEGAPVTANP